MLTPKNAQVIRIGHLRGFIPASWNDMPTPMLIEVYAAVLAAGYEPLAPGEVTRYQRLTVLATLLRTTPQQLTTLLGLGNDEHALQGEEREEALSALHDLLDQVTFCYEEVDGEEDEEDTVRLRLRAGLTRNPYPHITDKANSRLYGPSDGLENCTIYELASIFTLMSAYEKERDPALLRKLLATVYRPRKLRTPQTMMLGLQGDPRQALYKNDHLVDARARRWRKAPELVQSLLYFWLSSCRNAIVNAPELSVLFEKTGGQEDPDGWAGTLLHLAGESIVNIDTASTTHWPIALRQLAREKREAQRAEARVRQLGPA